MAVRQRPPSLGGRLRRFFMEITSPTSRYGSLLLLTLVLDIGLILAFAKLARKVRTEELAHFDAWVTAWVQGWGGPGLLPVMRAFTWLGSALQTAVVTLGAGWLLLQLERRWWEPGTLAVGVTGAAILDAVLKLVYKRPRPPEPWLTTAGGYSFPSGHSMVAFALYLLLGHLLWRHLPRRRWRLVASVALASVALLIGVSRIYLGVHYPSDVVAGFVAGGGWALACALALEALRPQRE